jgi:hypothetical protein
MAGFGGEERSTTGFGFGREERPMTGFSGEEGPTVGFGGSGADLASTGRRGRQRRGAGSGLRRRWPGEEWGARDRLEEQRCWDNADPNGVLIRCSIPIFDFLLPKKLKFLL